VTVLALALSAAVGAAIAVACSGGSSEDGASCDSNSDCKSGSCAGGTCAGSACECASGVCTTGTSCQGGWACVKESSGAGHEFPTCRRLCPDGTGCLADEHCDPGDNTCHDGIGSPSLSWVGLPRAEPCGAFKECPFEVKVSGGSGQIDHFEWTFDDSVDAGVTTTDPKTTHKYSPGSHTTTVKALDKNGTNGTLQNTDQICVDGVSFECSEGTVECCSGTCTPEGGCL
jgi:hypothetical protein